MNVNLCWINREYNPEIVASYWHSCIKTWTSWFPGLYLLHYSTLGLSAQCPWDPFPPLGYLIPPTSLWGLGAWSDLYIVELCLVDVPRRPAPSCREADLGMDLEEREYRESGGKGSCGWDVSDGRRRNENFLKIIKTMYFNVKVCFTSF